MTFAHVVQNKVDGAYACPRHPWLAGTWTAAVLGGELWSSDEAERIARASVRTDHGPPGLHRGSHRGSRLSGGESLPPPPPWLGSLKYAKSASGIQIGSVSPVSPQGIVIRMRLSWLAVSGRCGGGKTTSPSSRIVAVRGEGASSAELYVSPFQAATSSRSISAPALQPMPMHPFISMMMGLGLSSVASCATLPCQVEFHGPVGSSGGPVGSPGLPGRFVGGTHPPGATHPLALSPSVAPRRLVWPSPAIGTATTNPAQRAATVMYLIERETMRHLPVLRNAGR